MSSSVIETVSTSIEVKSVGKIFPARRRDEEPVIALGRASFSVTENEFFTMIGPSGCGKSTLLRIIAGLSSPTAGQIQIRGKRVTQSTPDVIVVWQEFARISTTFDEGSATC